MKPLDEHLHNSTSLVRQTSLAVEGGDQVLEIPRYLFIGPQGGGDPIKLGIFAGIHGDEPEGVHALIRFLMLVENEPEVAKGYCLFVYPVCNPSGFADRTRENRAGKDLNREFWRESSEPEVRALEMELLDHRFDGLISLHTDNESDGFYGYAHGASLTRDLLQPALRSAENYLPINRGEVIDGFRARNGIVGGRFEGILSAPPKRRPRPFEIILETPASPPTYLKEAALIAALRNVLVTYREFIAYAQNL